MADFASEFDKLMESKLQQVHKTRDIVVEALFSKIIDETPVDTGALKGSWKSGVGTPSADRTEVVDVSGEIPKAQLNAAIKAWPEEGPLFMSNNQKYSEGVEFDSWSVQRPMGMVRVNIAGREHFADLTTGTGRVG